MEKDGIEYEEHSFKFIRTNLSDIKDVAETVDKNNGLTYSVQKGIIKVKVTEASTLEAKIDTAVLSEMIGG